MTVIDDFRKELLPVLNGVSTSHLPDNQDRSFKTIMDQVGFLSFPNEIATPYRKALKTLRLMSNRSDKLISDKALENKFDNFLLELKYRENQEIVKREIDRHIVDFIESLKMLKSDKYLFLIPIMNLTIEEDIRISDSSIVTMSEQLFTSLETAYSIKFSLNQENHIEQIKQLSETNETQTYAIITVETPDSEKALELAIQKAEAYLNILRLYSNRSNFILRNEFKKTIGQRLIKANLDKKTYTEHNSSINLIGNHFPTIFDKAGIKKFNSDILPVLDPLLSKAEDELTSLQGDLLTAILWFGSAVKENDKNMKFVKGIMALEALLVPDGGRGKLEIIAKRFASIVFSTATNTEKKEAFEEMRNMYRLRSSIIHSGEGYIYEEDLEKMIMWVQSAIQIILVKSDMFANIQEIINKEFPIDEKIYN